MPAYGLEPLCDNTFSRYKDDHARIPFYTGSALSALIPSVCKLSWIIYEHMHDLLHINPAWLWSIERWTEYIQCQSESLLGLTKRIVTNERLYPHVRPLRKQRPGNGKAHNHNELAHTFWAESDQWFVRKCAEIAQPIRGQETTGISWSVTRG